MKKLILSLSIVVVAAVSLIACSKKGDSGNANPYTNNGYNGTYGSTPNDPRCGSGYPGFNYNHMYGQQMGYIQPGGYYPGQIPQNVNCVPYGSIYGGNPYYIQANYQFYLGTCDLRFAGRGQLCPAGYTCRPAFGMMGVCMRGY